MSLLQLVQQAQGGEGLSQLAKSVGLDRSEADILTDMFAPAIGSAAKKKVASGGLDDLLGSLMGEAQGDMFDNPAQAAAPEGQMQGMNFLRNLMGGERAPQAMAEEAAGRTGIDPSIIMQFLPALAAMMQGGMQRNLPDNDLTAMQRKGGLGELVGGLMGNGKGGPDLGALGKLLDSDGDGSPLDDILGRFMR